MRSVGVLFGGTQVPTPGGMTLADTWEYGDPDDCIPDADECGDGIVTAGEDCDTGGVNTSTCDGGDCTVPVCGDGYVNAAAGEQCDPPSVSANTASSNCMPGCLIDPAKVPTVSEWGLVAMTAVLSLAIGGVLFSRKRRATN
jgi:hypothetical protein